LENKVDKPNLFIVGAPKCGTTFLYHYLRKHPDIYFSDFKEPHFFGSDLIRKNKAYNLDASEYQKLFNSNKKIIGEASTFYIFSKNAAKEIYRFNPDAKIIIMLRNLVDLVHSMHSQFVFSGDETIEKFEEALNMENQRLKGEKIPTQTTVVNKLFYTSNILALPKNINSFISCFKIENIKFILLDEIKNKPADTYLEVLKFLGVDLNVDIPDFKVINKNKIYKSKMIRNFIKQYALFFGRIRQIIFNKPIGLFKLIEHLNTNQRKRLNLSQDLVNNLSEKFNKTSLNLEKLINKKIR
tara:strand:- start:13498 stop:14391 length:894 start_codon:yes stop_codon:yes gene_type:complete